MMHSLLRRHEITILLVLLAAATVARLYRISNPLLDWHAWRQADTASVTREYVKHGINPLHPTYLDLSSTPSGTDNPSGYRMVEFPLINIVTASLLRLFPVLPLELVSRIFSIVFSVSGLAALYGLVRTISGRRVAVSAAAAYAFLPFSMYYGRSVLPEPVLIGVVLISLYSFQRWLTAGKIGWYILAFISLLIGYLLKPYTIFFAPVFISLAYVRHSWKFILRPSLWIFAVLTPLPMLWWRTWIVQFPEGIPGSSWLFNGNEIRFKPAWIRWIFFERLNRLVSGTLGMIVIGANIFQLSRKEVYVYGSWWLGMLVYVTVFATGNVQHDYYQTLLIPIVAISLGRGAIVLFNILSARPVRANKFWLFVAWLIIILGYSSTLAFNLQPSGYFPEKILREFISMLLVSLVICALLYWRMKKRTFSTAFSVLVVITLLVGSVVFSWQYVSGYFNVNHWQYVRAGQAVQSVAGPDDTVIAPNMGDTQLLFQTDRRGWPIGGSIDEKIAQGADYYLSANKDDETKTLMLRFSTVTQTDEFVLLDLHAVRAATPSTEMRL